MTPAILTRPIIRPNGRVSISASLLDTQVPRPVLKSRYFDVAPDDREKHREVAQAAARRWGLTGWWVVGRWEHAEGFHGYLWVRVGDRALTKEDVASLLPILNPEESFFA